MPILYYYKNDKSQFDLYFRARYTCILKSHRSPSHAVLGLKSIFCVSLRCMSLASTCRMQVDLQCTGMSQTHTVRLTKSQTRLPFSNSVLPDEMC